MIYDDDNDASIYQLTRRRRAVAYYTSGTNETRGKEKGERKEKLKGTGDNTPSVIYLDVIPVSPPPVNDRPKGGEKGETCTRDLTIIVYTYVNTRKKMYTVLNA